MSAKRARGLRRLETLGGVGGEEAGEDRGDDGGEVDRIGPVVPGPRALLGRDETDAGHEARNHVAPQIHASSTTSHGNTEPPKHGSHLDLANEDPCFRVSVVRCESLSTNRDVAAEGLQAKVAGAAAVQRAAEVAAAAAVQRDRQVALEAAAEAVEVDVAASRWPAAAGARRR